MTEKTRNYLECQRQSEETGIGGGDTSRRNPQADLECLSGALRDEIFRTVYNRVLRSEGKNQSSIFGEFSEDCIDQIATKMEEEAFSRKEKIDVLPNPVQGQTLYYLFEGEVEVFLMG